MKKLDFGALLCRKILEKDYTSLIDRYFSSVDNLKVPNPQNKTLERIIELLQSMILSSQIYGLKDVEDYCIYICGLFMQIQDEDRQLSSDEVYVVHKSGVELKELLRKSIKNFA